jgi:hypothetical protein
VVYNMMRLAEYLLRWTGDPAYADYWERNLYNGIVAQQNPQTGMIAYFLPLQAGSVKAWGSPTDDFWCCHGSLVQAHTLHGSSVYYTDGDALVVCQYIPARLIWERPDGVVQVTMTRDAQTGSAHRPQVAAFDLEVTCAQPTEFALKLRLPWWLAGRARLTVNGKPERVTSLPSSFCQVKRTWANDRVRVELPKRLWTSPLPDRPDTVAFMDGPVALAGLCSEERTLHGDSTHPETMLAPHREREWGAWLGDYRTVGQEQGIRFVPLYEVVDERYTVYFPVRA